MQLSFLMLKLSHLWLAGTFKLAHDSCYHDLADSESSTAVETPCMSFPRSTECLKVIFTILKGVHMPSKAKEKIPTKKILIREKQIIRNHFFLTKRNSKEALKSSIEKDEM